MGMLNLRGITPACAGKTFLPDFPQARNGDHPRVCGENVKNKNVIDKSKGSPPRVRGKPAFSRMGDSTRWITPACAGKT